MCSCDVNVLLDACLLWFVVNQVNLISNTSTFFVDDDTSVLQNGQWDWCSCSHDFIILDVIEWRVLVGSQLYLFG